MEPNQEIKKDEEYAIRNQTQAEIDYKDQFEDIPLYKATLELTEEEQKELTKCFFEEYEAIEREMFEELKLKDKWKEADNLYDGELQENKNLIFNLHVQEAKIKTDAVVRALNEAFLDSDPMIDCKPRPESGRQNGFVIAEKQAEFLDYAIDEEIKPEKDLTKISYSSVKKFVGIGKICWKYKKNRRRREESYEGENVPVAIGPEGEVAYQNKGLEKFLSAYPDALEKQKGIIKRLVDEKKVDLVVEYKDTICNSPKLQYIKNENMRIRNGCDYNEGLADEHAIGEIQDYTYWELKKKEESGEFINVDQLFYTDKEKTKIDDGYKTKTYEVVEATTYFKTKKDDEEIKIKAWFGLERKVFLGAILYPYYGFDSEYIAFYVKLNDAGFWGDCKSVIMDLKDTNIAQDALLNLELTGKYQRNTMTPIAKEGSTIERQFLENGFTPNEPLIVDELVDDVRKAVDFVRWPNTDTNGSLVLMETMKRIGSDVTRVSDLMTGGESALDPSAPASKTIALLQQSGVGIKDYIRTYLPSFNIFASNVLQLYYQMSNEEKNYSVVGKARAVTGDNPFKAIAREEMIVKTNIESRAAAFVFDKMNEKREALAAYQVVMGDPFARQQPQLMYKALKVLLDTFGDRWKAIADKDLMSQEEFAEFMNQQATMAIQRLFQAAQQQQQATGVPVNQEQIMQQAPGAVAQAQAEAYVPPEEDE